MAKKKISGLPAGSALNGTELVPIVQTGTTKRITTQDIANLGNASGVEGSGTINNLAKFTASSTIGNSAFFDDGTNQGTETTTAVNRFIMSANASIAKIFSFRSANLPRWAFRVDGTESGANAGADLAIRRYNDAGTYVDSPLSFTRSTGSALFPYMVNILTANGNVLTFGLNGQPQITLFQNSTTYAFYNNTTGQIDFSINNTSGNGIFRNSLTVGAGLALSGATAPASGIEFPATQVASASANNLDDYEEGTWTMGVSFGGASVGVTYSTNTGTYTKIGRQVTISGFLSLSNKGTSIGNALITGLPFTNGNSTANYTSVSTWQSSITFLDVLMCYVDINSTTLALEQSTNLGVTSRITNVNFSNTSAIMFNCTYFV